MPDPALPQPRPGTVQPRRMLLRAAPRALAPSGRLGLGTEPLGEASLGVGRDITVTVGEVRHRSTRATGVRTRTVTTTARLS